MPRARSENSLKAEQLYREGKKLTEIAKQMGVPDGTVRRWKHDHDWDGAIKKKQTERSEKKNEKKKPNVRKSATVALSVSKPRKRGAPIGNKNSHGGPVGNQKARIHGAYSTVYWDFLEEGEREVCDNVPQDEEEMYVEQIALYTIRERRIMKAINKYRIGPEIYVDSAQRSEDKRTFENEEDKDLYAERIRQKIEAKERLPGDHYQMTTNTQNRDNMILRLEKELSTVQRAKNAAIDSLARLRMEKRKVEEGDQSNDLVRTWAEAVLRAREDTNAE